MGLLGTVGYLYLTILAFLLIIGFGLAGLQLITHLFTINSKSDPKSGQGKAEYNPWHRLILLSLLSVVLMITLMLLSNPWYQTGTNHHF